MIARLLDGKEWANLIPARADDADDGGGHQHDGIAADDENDARAQHEQRAEDKCALAPEPIRGCGQPQRDAGIACQRQREEQPTCRSVKPDLDKIQRQNYGEEPVAKQDG